MRELQLVDVMDLVAAYKDAQYAAIVDGDALRLPIGRHAVDLEAYWPARRYGFITAWNPASIPQTEAANAAAHSELTARLDLLGIARLPAQAQDHEGMWAEVGWLVADMEPPELDRVGREFGQAAVLAWSAGEPVRLRMLVPRPLQARDDACVDWAPEPVERPSRPRGSPGPTHAGGATPRKFLGA